MQIDEDLLRKEVNVVVNGLNKENVTGIFLDKSENIVGIDGYSNIALIIHLVNGAKIEYRFHNEKRQFHLWQGAKMMKGSDYFYEKY